MDSYRNKNVSASPSYDQREERKTAANEPTLVVMSNRAPIRVVREGSRARLEPTVGGVGTTFLRLLGRNGGLWIAWSEGQAALTPPAPAPHLGFGLSLVDLDEREVSQYYHGMCNRALWPLMHSMVSNCHFDAAHWQQYRAVNRKFAERAATVVPGGSELWIQDFHLALTPRLVRARRTDLPIGVFWHVPFPPVELYRVFPWRSELLEGMLGANLVGFHTPSYTANFLEACERVLGAQVDWSDGRVRYQSGTSRVLPFPLGIPADYFEQLAASPRIRERAQRIRRGLRSPVIVLGVDRLDYTKGILERLLGFERFLEINPAYHRLVTLVLIAVPSRTKLADYVRLKGQVDECVGRIVGRFSSEGWVPIRYLYTQLSTDELAAYYAGADIALLTPLRDGMNLVAKEFIAAHPNDDAVLILSEFAGAAEELTEALLVNPYDSEAIALRLRQAIEMSAETRAQRMSVLREKVRSNSLERWSSEFLGTLRKEFELEAGCTAEAAAH